MIENFFKNDTAIIFTAIVLLTAIPVGLTYMYMMKKAAMDADLKMKMLEMGMSASEIERVLAAKSDSEQVDELTGEPKRWMPDKKHA